MEVPPMVVLAFLALVLLAIIVVVIQLLREAVKAWRARRKLLKEFTEAIERGEAGDMQPWQGEPYRDWPALLERDHELRHRYERLTGRIQAEMRAVEERKTWVEPHGRVKRSGCH